MTTVAFWPYSPSSTASDRSAPAAWPGRPRRRAPAGSSRLAGSRGSGQPVPGTRGGTGDAGLLPGAGGAMNETPLETTPLGKTGLDITRVGFGAWAIGGGGWEFGWGPQDDDESIAAIQRALDLGVNWIDTAAAYGFGRSERMVGRALHGLTGDRRPYVFTKASLLEGPGRVV